MGDELGALESIRGEVHCCLSRGVVRGCRGHRSHGEVRGRHGWRSRGVGHGHRDQQNHRCVRRHGLLACSHEESSRDRCLGDHRGFREVPSDVRGRQRCDEACARRLPGEPSEVRRLIGAVHDRHDHLREV